MVKLAVAVMALIIAALVAGAYFDFNPAIAIFVILGIGIYGVGRIGGPLPPGGYQVASGGHGVYLERRDFVPPDPDSHSGPDFRDGVDPNARRGDDGNGLRPWR
jgi:hypothetical protein